MTVAIVIEIPKHLDQPARIRSSQLNRLIHADGIKASIEFGED
ncbi:hypothetical protein [Nocardia sp. NPDC046763]